MPNQLFAVLALVGCALAPPLDSALAQGRSEIGIDRSGLSFQAIGVQRKTLADIRTLHAAWFRDGPQSASPQGVAAFVEEVRLAKQQNLKVLMIVTQLDADYDGPLQKNTKGWNAKALSKIDLTRFGQRLQTLLGALKSASLTIDAVEFGSEDDTYYYDADVPSGHPASPAELHTWLQGYGAFLKTGASLVHETGYYPDAKIITFGMAHGGDPKESFANPAKAVAALKSVDGFNYLDNASYHVDGFGTHIYTSPSDPKGGATALLRQDIWALGRAKPIWVTEFGFLDPAAFQKRGGETLPQGLQDLLGALDDLSKRVPVGPLMFFAYSSGLTDDTGRLSGLVDKKGDFVPSAKVLAARAER